MSAYLGLTNTTFAALDNVFGDPLTITPQIAGEFTEPGPDSSKPAFIAIGILDEAAVVVEDASRSADAQTTTPIAEFAYTQFGPGRPVPSIGWRIDAPFSPLKAPTGGFLIVDFLPDRDDGRCRFQLAALT